MSDVERQRLRYRQMEEKFGAPTRPLWESFAICGINL